MKNNLIRKNLCVLGSLMILLGIFMPYYTYNTVRATSVPAAATMAMTGSGPCLAGVAAAALAFSAVAWYFPAGVIGIASLVLSLLNLIDTLQNNAAVAGKGLMVGAVRGFGPGFWILLAGSVMLLFFAFSGLVRAIRKRKAGASPRPQFKNILCRKNLCVLSGLLIAFSFFLPFLIIGSSWQIYGGYSLDQFRLGFLVIVFGLAAVIFSAFEKFIPAFAAGIASAFLFLFDFFGGGNLLISVSSVSIPMILEKTSNTYCGSGCYVLPAASVALVIFSVWGFIERRKRLRALLAERLIP